MVLLNYHKSIACLPHQPDFVMIHHIIYGVTFFKHLRSFIKESGMGVGHLVLRWCWERTIRQILSRLCNLFSCFLVSLFSCGIAFRPVIRFTPVLINVVFLTLGNQNSSFPLHFLFRFSFLHRSAMMGKSLCRVHVYNYVDFDSDKTKPASEVRAILKRFSDFSVHINSPVSNSP